MHLAVFLLMYAFAVGWGVDLLLSRARILHVFPKPALWIWHATAFATLAAFAVALLLLAHDVWETGISWALHANKQLVHTAYEGPRHLTPIWNLAFGALLCVLAAVAWQIWRAWTQARRQATAHQLLVRPWPAGAPRRPEVGLIEDDELAIYCVAGARATTRILVTSGAVAHLSQEQLEAALAHEQGHVDGRHHAMVVIAESIGRLAGMVGLLRHYSHAVCTLAELAADDAASRRHGQIAVAGALLQMCTPRTTESPRIAEDTKLQPGLAWTGSDPATRVRRLLAPAASRPTTRTVATIVTLCVLALFGLPIVAVGRPALDLVGTRHDDSPTQVSDGGPRLLRSVGVANPDRAPARSTRLGTTRHDGVTYSMTRV